MQAEAGHPDSRLKRTSLTLGSTRALACGSRRPRRLLPFLLYEADRTPRCGRRGRRPRHARRVCSPGHKVRRLGEDLGGIRYGANNVPILFMSNGFFRQSSTPFRSSMEAAIRTPQSSHGSTESRPTSRFFGGRRDLCFKDGQIWTMIGTAACGGGRRSTAAAGRKGADAGLGA